MNEWIVWIIIAAFYAPLHFMLPVLFLFVTGEEAAAARRALVRQAVHDAALSMGAAIALAAWLTRQERIVPAMVILMLSMAFPFVGILRRRRLATSGG